MRIKQTIAAFAIALLALALLTGATRTVNPALVGVAAGKPELLYAFGSTTIDADTDCMSNALLVSQPCNTDNRTRFLVPKDILITEVVAYVKVAGSAGYTCTFDLTDDSDGTPAGLANAVSLVVPASAAAKTWHTQSQTTTGAVTLTGGQHFTVEINVGASTCTGVIDPQIQLFIYGKVTG